MYIVGQIMGGCSSKVGYTSTGVSNPPPPPQDREEVYHDLHIYLKESYTKANKLQEAFVSMNFLSCLIDNNDTSLHPNFI